MIKGDPLAKLGIRALLARRDELKAELAVRRATRQQTETRLELARITAERRTKLLKRDNVSRQSYDEAMFDVEALRSERTANAADIQRVSALLRSLDVDIEKSSMRAPFDGTIVVRRIDEGTAVTAGTPVLRLIEDGVKEVRIGIPPRVTPNLAVGETYPIDIDGRLYRCRLVALLAALDAETRTIPAIFQIDDPYRDLRSGQLAQLQLDYTVPAKGFWLPLGAMVGGRRGLWNAYALVESDEIGFMRTSRRELQILHSESHRAFVRGTLKDGDLVVSGGLHRLVPGQLVTVDGKAE